VTAPPPPGRGRPVVPGQAAFSEQIHVPRPRGKVLAEALARIAPPLQRSGYELRAYERNQARGKRCFPRVPPSSALAETAFVCLSAG
jgi:hypothetical protein